MTKASATTKNKNEHFKQLNVFLASYFNLVTAAIVLLILSVGFILIILPKYRQIDTKVKAANEQLETEYANLTRYLNKLRAINNDYSQINQESVNKIRKFLPDEPQTESLIEKMEYVAKNNGVILDSLEVESDQGEPDKTTGEFLPAAANPDLPAGVGLVKITANLSGASYEVFKNLITVLEKSLRLMDIIELKFSPGDKKVTLTINTYYLK